jgi:hypothetical protein
MMFDDPIVEGIRRERHAHAAQFGNDLRAIVEDLRRLERESGRQHVVYPPRRIEDAPSTRPLPLADTPERR